jgi:voltage-gated potassium channel
MKGMRLHTLMHRNPDDPPPPLGNSIKDRLWRIIFLADTPGGKWFDIILLWLIACSVLVVMLETVHEVHLHHGLLLKRLEWGFTLLFSIEYAVRLWVVRRKRRYATSFFGIVDLLSIIPTYLEFFLTGSTHLIVIRILRMLRMFRILKMGHHIEEADLLIAALKASRSKIAVFLFAVMTVISIESTLMYLVENGSGNTGFTSIPQSIYWGIVTLTTVGYGDITPVTVAGKFIASIMMITGFSIIAVPAGIVTAELQRERSELHHDSRKCAACDENSHESDARFCKRCGAPLATFPQDL